MHAIRGLAWDDADGDGLRAGEPGLAGRTIYLDLDNDGMLGAEEPTATTATDGSYAFADLSAGHLYGGPDRARRLGADLPTGR